jgi:hypothetical protein
MRHINKALSGVAIIAMLMAAYLAGYVGLGETLDWPSVDRWRIYPYRWQAFVFKPAAKVESMFSRNRDTVKAMCQGDLEFQEDS